MSGFSALSHVALTTIPGAPSPRAAHTCDVVQNFLVIFGGWSGREALGDAYAFHLKKKRWYLLNLRVVESSGRRSRLNNVVLDRNNHASAVYNNELYVYAGHDGSKWLGDMFAIDVGGLEENVSGLKFGQSVDVYVRLIEGTGKVPTRRACHSMTLVGQLFYTFGGYDGNQCFNDLDVFDPTLGSWSRLSKPHGKKPAARNAHAMVSDGRNLYLLGGHSGSVHFDDLFMYSINSHTWTCINCEGRVPPGVRGHCSAFHKGEIYLFGGYNGDVPFNSLYVFNLRSSTWSIQDVSYDEDIERRQRSTMVTLPDGGTNNLNWYVKNVGGFMNMNSFSDVVIMASGKEIPAHKLILAANSPYFMELLSNENQEEDKTGTTSDTEVNGTEEKPAQPKKTVIELNEWSFDSVMKLLEFLYTARVEDLGNSSHYRVCEIMGLADSCSVVRLKNLCEEVLVTKLDIENSCYLLKCSKLYNADYLRQCCFDFISENAADVMLTPGFEDLSSVPSLVLELAKLSINKMT